MHEDLAREFPEAVRALSWTRAHLSERRPIVTREPVVWAAVSGIGAGFLVASVAGMLVALMHRALTLADPHAEFSSLAPLATVAGTAAAAGAALAIGGRLALALDLAYVVLGIGVRIPGTIAFCERSGRGPSLLMPDACTPTGFLSILWPQLIGIGLGLAMARVLAVRGEGSNSLLRVAGTLAIALSLASAAWALTIAQTASPAASGLTIAAGTVAAAIAAGVVAAQLSRGIRSAAIVAGIWLLPWLTLQLPLALQNLGPPVPQEFVISIIAGVASEPIAAVFMLLTAAVAARSRFIPREPA